MIHCRKTGLVLLLVLMEYGHLFQFYVLLHYLFCMHYYLILIY